MAGHFTPKDPIRCPHYALFASHLERWQFDILYWILFVFNLLVLFCASWFYIKGLDALENHPKGTRAHRRTIAKCIALCAACVAISTVTVVMEVFILLALQFCDGEDLMSLYWSTFTMIQIGSLIAVVGIIVALLHSLHDRKHPPWALALGTPVLVFAGIYHFLHDCVRKRVRNLRKSSSRDTLPISQVNTLSQEPPPSDSSSTIHDAEVIGFTVEGGPIIRFTQSVREASWGNPEIVSTCRESSSPIVFYGKDGAKLVFGDGGSPEGKEG